MSKFAGLCVPVCVQHAHELRAAVMRAAEVADIIELRLDCLADDAELAAAQSELSALLNERPRPFIFTFRAPTQGGQRPLPEAARLRFWQQSCADWAQLPQPDFVDIELDLLETKREEVWPFNPTDAATRPTLICSHHDFAGSPADLAVIYERMTRTPAHVCKLAVRAHDATDALPLLQLLARARREGRALIAIAMGTPGLLTRILAPARGALLTYGALDAAQATAPGQITAADLRDLYRLHTLDAQTEVFGLVGMPVAHSISPHMHNAAFAARSLNAVYVPFEVRDVAAFIRRMTHPRTRELDLRLRGLSITAPHKQTIMAHLDGVAPAAQEIGAVNTVVVAGEELRGYNTDAAAALAPLADVLELRGAQVAIIGAGGAARAVLWGMQRAGAHVTLYARDSTRAAALAAQAGVQLRPLAAAGFAGCDLVVNTTPLGTHGHAAAETPAESAQLRGARVVYDLVYNPAETRFMRAARAAGCAHVLGGLAMLVAQAAAQFELWTGQPAPIAAMQAAAEKQRSEVRA
ncbi:MAG TPA: shikimate dehydrogenase [Pyrinomonadaceae bacterium]|jgi:3-dehydroquinate dehydratase/shikimate dehydrogenase